GLRRARRALRSPGLRRRRSQRRGRSAAAHRRPRAPHRPTAADRSRRRRALAGALMPGATATGALGRALRRYTRAPIAARLFVHGRAFLSDLAVVERYVPKKGFIVDLGCGHGLFACVLREASP